MVEHPYGWLSLLPPVVTIILAIATRRIIVSLVVGIFAGALLTSGGDVLTAIRDTWEIHLWRTLIEPEKMRVFSFTLLMGSMVGVITRSGGMRGLIDLVSPWARTRRRGQLVTWLLGMLIFFDDYANTILLGYTLRPICDRLKISREKLAYLVDSTAAPVAGLALVSTWVAVEVEYIANGLESISTSNEFSAFNLFVASIPYRFYVWAALLLVPMTALFRRDFGPMQRAELRCVAGDVAAKPTADMDLVTDELLAKTSAWYNAVLPIGVMLAMVLYFIYVSGSQSKCESIAQSAISAAEASSANSNAIRTAVEHVENVSVSGDVAATIMAIQKLGIEVESIVAVDQARANFDENVFHPEVHMRDIVGAANSSLALQYGALGGLLVAMAMAWMFRLLDGRELFTAAADGARIILPAIAILWCASAMSRMTTDRSVNGDVSKIRYEFKDHRLYTAAHLTQVLSGQDPQAEPSTASATPGYAVELLPTIVFVLAALVAFCTGTSWGTMGILLPMVVPLAHTLLVGRDGGMTPSHPIFLSSIAGVLAGSVFGDHCSPISDTTVLSSQSSGCDHLAHVWTQMPYALVAAAVSIGLGTLPVGFGVPVWLLLPLQLLALGGILWLVGKPVPE